MQKAYENTQKRVIRKTILVSHAFGYLISYFVFFNISANNLAVFMLVQRILTYVFYPATS